MVGNLVVKAATRCGAGAGDLYASTRIGRQGGRRPNLLMSGPVGGTGEKQNGTNAMCQAASCNLVAGDNKSRIEHRSGGDLHRSEEPANGPGGRPPNVRAEERGAMDCPATHARTVPGQPPAGDRGGAAKKPGLPAVDLVVGHQAEDTHALVRP